MGNGTRWAYLSLEGVAVYYAIPDAKGEFPPHPRAESFVFVHPHVLGPRMAHLSLSFSLRRPMDPLGTQSTDEMAFASHHVLVLGRRPSGWLRKFTIEFTSSTGVVSATAAQRFVVLRHAHAEASESVSWEEEEEAEHVQWHEEGPAPLDRRRECTGVASRCGSHRRR